MNTIKQQSNKFLKEGRHYSSAYSIRFVCVGGETWKKVIGKGTESIQILPFSLNKNIRLSHSPPNMDFTNKKSQLTKHARKRTTGLPKKKVIFHQQQPSLFPLSGVSYMDQITP
jgi:hypothetical protein